MVRKRNWNVNMYGVAQQDAVKINERLLGQYPTWRYEHQNYHNYQLFPPLNGTGMKQIYILCRQTDKLRRKATFWVRGRVNAQPTRYLVDITVTVHNCRPWIITRKFDFLQPGWIGDKVYSTCNPSPRKSVQLLLFFHEVRSPGSCFDLPPPYNWDEQDGEACLDMMKQAGHVCPGLSVWLYGSTHLDST